MILRHPRRNTHLRAAFAAALAAFALAAAPTTAPSDDKASANQAHKQAPEAPEQHADPAYVLDHQVTRIDGKVENLTKYEGKVVLIVNVASQCGYTKQYAGLETLYDKYRDDGLVVLGFPANDFGKQEPGTNQEIREFCRSRFDVSFPMFEKIAVIKGKNQSPLYKDLTDRAKPIGGDPKWNFTKFLVDRSGRVVKRFESNVEPLGPQMTKAIEQLIATEH
ncbi:MAG: glutathione peroxidase [Phycisphaerae bacterium]|nr:glutathione peroxidase [Phycisphaerae bacterium]